MVAEQLYKVNDTVTLIDNNVGTILKIIPTDEVIMYQIKIKNTDKTQHRKESDIKCIGEIAITKEEFNKRVTDIDKFIEEHSNEIKDIDTTKEINTVNLLYKNEEIKITPNKIDYVSLIKSNNYKAVFIPSNCFNFNDSQLKKAYPELMILDLSTIRGDYNKLGTIKIVTVYNVDLIIGYTHYEYNDSIDYLAFAMICKKLNHLCSNEVLMCMNIDDTMRLILNNELKNKYKEC